MNDIVQWVQLGTNLGLLGIGFKMIRFISRMEFKVDILWQDYEDREKEFKRFGK